MEAVKEESIDESIEVEAKFEATAPDVFTAHHSDSLPSEDVEIKDSGKSTDWQILIKERSRKGSVAEAAASVDKLNEIEEDIDDLNEREEQNLEEL
jgi:hypothetical protein